MENRHKICATSNNHWKNSVVRFQNLRNANEEYGTCTKYHLVTEKGTTMSTTFPAAVQSQEWTTVIAFHLKFTALCTYLFLNICTKPLFKWNKNYFHMHEMAFIFIILSTLRIKDPNSGTMKLLCSN